MSAPSFQPWTTYSLLELARSYQPAAILAAAADLDLFSVLATQPLAAVEAAQQLTVDRRGLVILLDALAALGLLLKQDGRYSPASGVAACLTPRGAQSVLAMVQHQANCLRRWTQLAEVVKTGRPAERKPSVRGEAGDRESFIGAMHNVSDSVAAEVIQAVQPVSFHHLLDVGGASGTWTIAFLRDRPSAVATLFDLPEVLPLARERLAQARLSNRVEFVGGDFTKDTLPGGCDLAWVSAIVHQNSRAENRALFGQVFQGLVPGGWIAVRDVLMRENRTEPILGALFAVNMLVGTAAGGTFTFEELREDLAAAGFSEARVARLDAGMNSVVVAQKPAG
jgi:SAM-dependent methyltransferase